MSKPVLCCQVLPITALVRAAFHVYISQVCEENRPLGKIAPLFAVMQCICQHVCACITTQNTCEQTSMEIPAVKQLKG